MRKSCFCLGLSGSFGHMTSIKVLKHIQHVKIYV